MTGHDLAMALRGAYLSLHRRTDAVLSRTGVTADQFVVLAALSQGVARTQRVLVERTSSDPNSLRAMLVLLERRGLVQRHPNPRDGRARSVSLTRKGRSVFDKAWRLTEPLRQELMNAVAPIELREIVHQLQQLAVDLEHKPSDAAAERRRMPSRASS